MEQPNDAQPNPEKEIFVDEGWKARVEAEREKAAAASPASPGEKQARKHPLPPASLTLLTTTVGMQAMMGLGLMPNPATGKPEVDLDQARHFIDTLAVLQEKTENNRTPEESTVLEDLLHQLRMAYVEIGRTQS